MLQILSGLAAKIALGSVLLAMLTFGNAAPIHASTHPVQAAPAPQTDVTIQLTGTVLVLGASSSLVGNFAASCARLTGTLAHTAQIHMVGGHDWLLPQQSDCAVVLPVIGASI